MAARIIRKLFVFPARLIVFVMETYAANRGRLKALMAKPGLARGFRAMVMLTALAWLLIALFAGKEHGERLDKAFDDLKAHINQPAETQGQDGAVTGPGKE